MQTYQDRLQSMDDAGEFFFDLANERSVQYRSKSESKHHKSLISIKQDPDVEDCTGGIVWETAYLLATFLEHRGVDPSHKVLEVGAGCGLLGLVLASYGCKTVLTEVPQAMSNLRHNVRLFTHKHGKPKSSSGGSDSSGNSSAAAVELRWEEPEDRAAVLATYGSFDWILGTDVIFSTSLVSPLLETLLSMSHAQTEIWLCFQQRCRDAHTKLLATAPELFHVSDESESLSSTPDCEFAADMECFLLKLRPKQAPPRRQAAPVASPPSTKNKNSKKRKRDPEAAERNQERDRQTGEATLQDQAAESDETKTQIETSTSTTTKTTLNKRTSKKNKIRNSTPTSTPSTKSGAGT